MSNQRASKKTTCIILGGGRGTRLYPLTKERAKPAVPLGGKYRLVDVPIGNCLNSGLNQMFVLTQFQSASLHRHMQGSYRFDRFSDGFVEILAAEQTEKSDQWYQGTSDAVLQNLVHFGDEADEVLILSGDQLYAMDYQELLATHRRTGADATIAMLPVDADTAPAMGIMDLDKEGHITAFREKPPKDQLNGLEADPALFRQFGIDAPGRPYLASMGIYVFDRELLFGELREHRHVDFGKNLFPALLKQSKHLQAHIFDGYWEDIGTVASFHEANLALGRADRPFEFNTERGLIYTRPRTLPGSIFGECAMKDSVVAEGCTLGSGTYDNCVVGIRSRIGAGGHFARTLFMGNDFYEHDHGRAENRRLGRPDLGIGSGCTIEDAIVDKNVRIGNDVVIKNPAALNPNDESMVETDTYVVRDGVICILKGAVIPDGTVIDGS